MGNCLTFYFNNNKEKIRYNEIINMDTDTNYFIKEKIELSKMYYSLKSKY